MCKLNISLCIFFFVWVVVFQLRRDKGAFTYDVRFLGRYVGQAASDFTKKAYRKVASSRLSRLVAHFWIFRLLMKEKFDAYVL